MSKTMQPESKLQNVTVAIHHKPACRVELEVKAPPELVAAARKDAVKKVGKEVSMPGFRKGKAPEEMILKKFPAQIESQWHKSIADAAFASAQLQARVPMLQTGSPVTFDLKKHSLEEGAELVFSFETEPQVPAIDPKKFTLRPVTRIDVDEKKMDEAIRQMLYFYAQWKPVTDRGIQEGDTIMIDLETIEGEPQKVFHHVRFEVSQARMAEWMKRLAIGARAGDVLEGVSEPDENATEEEKKEFSSKKVRLSILKVEEALLPELNDEFAKKVGSTDVAALRETVRSILQKNVDDKERDELREQVNDFLIQNYSFELPLSLIETEMNHRKSQVMNDPKYRDAFEKLSSEEKKKYEEKIYNESSQAVRLFYLSRQVVRDAKISITQREVQQEAVHSAEAFGRKVDPDQLPKEIYALALSKVILAKAQDYILKESAKEIPQEPIS